MLGDPMRRARAEQGPIVLEGNDGLRVSILTHGASIQAIELLTHAGPINVCLGYRDPREYRHDPYFMGSTVGRYAGRIDRGRLSVQGASVALAVGAIGAPHCLHGGPDGFHSRQWELTEDARPHHVLLRIRSPSGDQGFPGALDATVRYQVLNGWQLAIDYCATTTSDTVINLANHAYFNLDGDSDSVLDHIVRLHAEQFTPLLPSLIPTGQVCTVQGTEFDLRCPTRLRERMATSDKLHNGFDQNFVVDGAEGELRPAAEVFSPRSGLYLTVHTTQPGLQLYTGGSLGSPFKRFGGLCLETQNFPDAPNQASFPDPWLRAGQVYRHRTVYEFRQ
jgi:aldose 1-epimerase